MQPRRLHDAKAPLTNGVLGYMAVAIISLAIIRHTSESPVIFGMWKGPLGAVAGPGLRQQNGRSYRHRITAGKDWPI